MQKEIDTSRRMGTSAFKKEINYLLHTRTHVESGVEFDTHWNCRDHALVMALLLKRKGVFPKIAIGKCMYVQGPYLKYSSIGVGQEHDYATGHAWVVDQTFGLIDVSPVLEIKKHTFRAAFNGIFGRVWLPRDKDRVNVIVCDDPGSYEREIDKAAHLTGQTTAIYLNMEEVEVADRLIEAPFKFLGSDISDEIKNRFGPGFYPAVANHLQHFMLGQADTLTEMGELEAWNTAFDKFNG
jgi:hypothetical protein